MSVYELYKMNQPGDQIQIQELLKKNLIENNKEKAPQPGVAPKVNKELAKRISLLDRYVEDVAMNIQDEQEEVPSRNQRSFIMDKTRNSVILETNDEYI